MEQGRLALDTDPLSLVSHLIVALSMYTAKQYRETIEYVRKALEIDANYYPIWIVMGYAQLRLGFAQEAIASFKRVVELAPWYPDSGWYLATSHHLAGDHERSHEWVRKLAGAHGDTHSAAIYYAAARDVDAMFEALDGSYQRREPRLNRIPYEPFFDPYHADPRFQALLQRMNLA